MTETLSYQDPLTGARGWLAYDGGTARLAAGGCRMRPGLSGAELGALAARMTLKQQVLGLNVQGAKCGLDHDPRAADAEQVLSGFLGFLAEELRTRFSMGSDMGTDWNQLQRLAAGHGLPSVKYAVKNAQGLSDDEFLVRMSRLKDRVGFLTLSQRRAGHILGHAAIGAARAAHRTGPLTVALQGFGTLGRAAAHAFLDEGVRLVAVADEHGAIASPGGLDLSRLLASAPGTPVPGLDPALALPSRESLFDVEADVLVLAAGADAFDADRAARLRCAAVAVGANLGLSDAVERALHLHGVLVVPDFIGGIGGSASMEVLFGPKQAPTAEQVLSRSAHLTRQLVDELFQSARLRGLTPRDAAMELAARTKVDPDAPAYGHCPYLTLSDIRA
ncbi:Glu/Leu/Phe/Val dehydrogenase dimerization domain-containing protein [Kitasatospora sp. CB02891]|uniref:Glu/Leu/Phe/Val dehydrogenase dimerization domain-containing protein n=1 Tax=Kitasatospora sp. CB02891 TaxID=2020329 RepID=UPI000C273485|nr:Glu/Leu/Phe/Val dehydrogenase dimerization domain-containing protein [Kitasatospora sp. CB02891]PJN23229.1 glutamate dehydrogenase [Kitasatospora sp. CB02891]